MNACMDEAECWCVYSPNTPAVSAERVVGSLPGIRSTCMTPVRAVDLFEFGLREISQQAKPKQSDSILTSCTLIEGSLSCWALS